MRLTNFNKDLKYKLHRYNKKEIESNLFYFNISRNFFIYENLNNIKYNNISNIITYNNACGDNIENINMVIIDTTGNINMGDFTPNYINSNNYK